MIRWGVMAGSLLCLADWVLIEDFGFLGGLGTDPNSMIPMALVFVAGYLALTPSCRRSLTRWPVAVITPTSSRHPGGGSA